MDGSRFDDLARTLAIASSRRRALTGLAGALAGLVGLRRDAGAQACRGPGRLCQAGGNCCSRVCNPQTNRCECRPAEEECNRQCVDRATGFLTDPRNCGSCGNVCPAAPCRTAVCENGVCGTQPNPALNGRPCDDGDRCTVNGVCQEGTCVGQPVDCSALNDDCNLGVCNPANGQCRTQPTREGESCEDDDPCTTGETCRQGVCRGAPLCPPGDVCSAGSCTCTAGGSCEAASPCAGGDPCFCETTAEQGLVCADERFEACDANPRCQQTTDCPEGLFCVTSTCCPNPVCLPPCGLLSASRERRFGAAPRSAGVLVGALVVALAFVVLTRQPAAAADFTVDRTDDVVAAQGCTAAANDCSLRGAVIKANGSPGADRLILPAGTYTLTIGPFDDEFNLNGAVPTSGDLDILNGDLIIDGADPATTIIQAGTSTATAIDRVIDVNNFAGPGIPINVTLQDLTVRHGKGPTAEGYFTPGGAVMFDGFDPAIPGSSTKALTIVNCRVVDNEASGVGGGVVAIFGTLSISGSEISGNRSLNGSGGGLHYDGGAFANGQFLQITTSTIANNRTEGLGLAGAATGGGIRTGGGVSVTIQNTSITGNVAAANGGGLSIENSPAVSISGGTIGNNDANGDGGGIWSNAFNPVTNAPSILTITSVTITDNDADADGNGTGNGGGILNFRGALTMNFNRVAGNSAGDATTSGLRHQGGTLTNVANNWWGRNGDPASDPTCDRVSGTAGAHNPRLVLTLTANPGSILPQGATTLTASFLTNSAGSAIAIGNLTALIGLPITFANATLGAISSPQTTIQPTGTATATFTAGAATGNGSATATVDNGQAVANIPIRELTATKEDAIAVNNAGPSTEANPSDVLEYAIVIANSTGQSATSVAFSDTPDANTTLVIGSVTTTSGAITSGNTAGSTSVGVSGITVAPGGSVTIRFRVTIVDPFPVGSLQVANQGVATRGGIATIPTDDPAAGGASDLTVTQVVVLNQPPTAEAGGPYEVGEGGAVQLDGTGSSDPDQPANTLTYAWDLDGDTVFGETGAGATRGDETGSAPTFSAAGLDGPSNVSVALRVTDNANAGDDDTAAIAVRNLPPVVADSRLAPTYQGQGVKAYALFTDPGPNDAPFTCTVDYGDGSGPLPGTIGPTLRDRNQLACTGPTHTYAGSGTFTITIRVTDKDGDTGENTTQHVISIAASTSGWAAISSQTSQWRLGRR